MSEIRPIAPQNETEGSSELKVAAKSMLALVGSVILASCNQGIPTDFTTLELVGSPEITLKYVEIVLACFVPLVASGAFLTYLTKSGKGN